MIQTVVYPIIRHLLTVGAGALIVDGTITDAHIQVISAAIVAIATIGWSIIEKKHFSQK